MDGISLAASIIQIIDLSSRVVSKSIDIYRSSDGQLIEHNEIDEVTKALSASARRIDQLITNSASRTDAEIEQEQLGVKCREIADKLVEVLNKLKSSGRPGKWRSFRQALKAAWNEDKIAGLEKRLDRYRQQMIANIVETLRLLSPLLDTMYLQLLTLRCADFERRTQPVNKLPSSKASQTFGVGRMSYASLHNSTARTFSRMLDIPQVVAQTGSVGGETSLVPSIADDKGDARSGRDDNGPRPRTGLRNIS